MRPLIRLFAMPAIALSLALSAPVATADPLIETSVAADSLKKSKRTEAELYLTAEEAATLVSTRDDILLIDVRTPEETVLVGYPTDLDANIPLKLFDPTYTWNTKKDAYQMRPNTAFVETAKAYLEGKEPAAVLVMCRSGSRSAQAVDMLIKAGVDLPLYSVVDGFEGDRNKDGLRDVNGWQKAGAAWTQKPRKDLLLLQP